MILFAVFSVILTGCGAAAASDAGVARLIPADSVAVYSVNVDPYRHSPLSKFFPLYLPGRRDALAMRLRSVVTFAGPERGRAVTTILHGPVTAADFLPPGAAPALSDGQPITTIDAGTAFAPLSSDVGVLADPQSVARMVSLWRRNDPPDRAFAEKLQSLEDQYDNWLLLIEPLASLADFKDAPKRQPRNQILGLIRELRAGVRLGPVTDIRVEAVVRNSDDAATIAGLARWLPDFLRLRHHGAERDIAALAENIAVSTAGAVVTLTFTIEERKLEERIREYSRRDSRACCGH
jgi:hypothetical protein